MHTQRAACGLGKEGDPKGWCQSIQRAIIHYLLTWCPTCTCCHNSVCFNHIRKIALLLPKSISWRCCLHNIQGQIFNKAVSRVVLTLEKMPWFISAGEMILNQHVLGENVEQHLENDFNKLSFQWGGWNMVYMQRDGTGRTLIKSHVTFILKV